MKTFSTQKQKSNLAKLEKKFKKVYDSWGEKTFCPSLGKDVYFTDTGWNHIRKGTRAKPEIERRLKLLPLSKRLLEENSNPPTRHFRTFRSKRKAYYKLAGMLDEIPVAVVLIKIKGKFTFLSTFEEYEKQDK